MSARTDSGELWQFVMLVGLLWLCPAIGADYTDHLMVRLLVIAPGLALFASPFILVPSFQKIVRAENLRLRKLAEKQSLERQRTTDEAIEAFLAEHRRKLEAESAERATFFRLMREVDQIGRELQRFGDELDRDLATAAAAKSE